ncbi:PmoA family protein [Paenibacillus hamazuiensis]|uniref:DUF6807 domain-containing protein n=1 Tax=Paenibacillus hamazuiensis TaxID=2936508 RepID=UPI00200EF480|nr:PmoA family protein [Paenibacillus hamazuiensis]
MSFLFSLVVHAGNHLREFCPVSFTIPTGNPVLRGNPAGLFYLQGPGGETVPLQCEETHDDLVFHWIVERLLPGESRRYDVYSGENPASEAAAGVRLDEKERQIDVLIGGTYFTSCVFDPDLAKPYIGPVMGPYGDSFTRLDFETKEHPHHRSLWLAIGDVNGIDMWNEPKDKHGKQRLAGFAEKTSGPVFGRLKMSLDWCTYSEKPQLAEKRTVTFYNTPAGGRIIDLDFEFVFNRDRVEFGATKEAGPLGIRVAESMKAENGGTITNSHGSIGEAECWGQRAVWCDYSGNVGGHTLGIAAFDHPDNDGFPTYWHVRDYGLLAANNFYFAGGKLYKKGQSVRYKHRVYFHEGDAAAGKVAHKYQDYIHPPVVTRVEEE